MVLVQDASPTAVRRAYLIGCGLVLLAGLLWSFGGVTVRLAGEADGWQYMIYRSLGQGVALWLWSRTQRRPVGLVRSLIQAGPLMWLASALVAAAAICYIEALKLTLVSNVMLLNATSPLWTAVLAALLLGERFDRITVLSLVVGTVGIMVMVQGDFGSGDLVGNGLGMLSAFTFAVYSICLRVAGTRDSQPVVFGFALFGFLGALVGTLVEGRSPEIPPLDVAVSVLHGFVFMTIGMILFVRSAKVVPAAELTILAQTETIFGPVWVWLAFGEVPHRATLAGGALILAAVVLKAVTGVRKPPARVAD